MQSKKFFKSNSLFNKLLFGLKKNSSRKNYTAVNKESAVSSDNKNLSAIRNVVNTTEIVRLTFNSIIDEQAKQVYTLEKILKELKDKTKEKTENKSELPDIPNIRPESSPKSTPKSTSESSKPKIGRAHV